MRKNFNFFAHSGKRLQARIRAITFHRYLMDWFTAYTNNAQEAANDKNTARKKTVAVDLDDSDKQYLRALFNRIAGEDKKKLSFLEFFYIFTKYF